MKSIRTTTKISFLIMSSFFYLTLVSQPWKNSDDVLKFVRTLLPKNPVILEAGGHHGEDTSKMKLLWPQATMHVFEPLPISFAKLTENTKNLLGVFRYPYALSDHTGASCFYINFNNNAASSIGEPVNYNKHEFINKPITVNCLTIDDWAQGAKIDHIDFMWLDMEGYELHALKKATSILPKVIAIYTEIDFVEIRQKAGLYTDLKNFLNIQGFQEIWKSNCGRFGDALFIKKNPLQDKPPKTVHVSKTSPCIPRKLFKHF